MKDLRQFIKTTIREYLNENYLNDNIKNYLIDGKYLFHYTLTDYLDDILHEGLIPRKNPNSYYKDGSEGIFLTTSQSLYKANLPQSLMDVMDEYYEDEENYETKPIVRLWIDVTKLDLDKLIWDDDYILNKYGWNKSETDTEKIIESLDIWGSVAYLGIIPKNLIVNYDFDYLN
jgi:hypothetical protein